MKNIKKILIIEDEKTLARALELKLGRSGYVISVVSNGEDGIELLKNDSFSLVLLDLIMPKMDGFTFLETLNSLNIKTPVMVLTNLSHENDIERTKKFGAKDFFIKSNTPMETILKRIKEILK
jgi:DNA-binding response OmpR family regulator